LYLIFISQFGSGILFGIQFVPYLASQNLFASGWTAILLILGLIYLPDVKNKFTGPLAIFGKATYHIFLVQIVYFGIFGGYTISNHSLNDLFSVNNVIGMGIPFFMVLLLGVGFYELDKNNFFFGSKFRDDPK
jgi:hypothetical protein